MLESRCGHCALASNDSIFAFGGYNGTHLSSMERYEIARDEWLPSSAMREKRFNFCFRLWFLKVYINLHIQRLFSWHHSRQYHLWFCFALDLRFNFIIFNFWLFSAIGGYNGNSFLNTVERFDQRVGNWEHIAPMSNRKNGAGAAVLDGKIYVAGGLNGNYLNTVEMFEFTSLLAYPFALSVTIHEQMPGVLVLQWTMLEMFLDLLLMEVAYLQLVAVEMGKVKCVHHFSH